MSKFVVYFLVLFFLMLFALSVTSAAQYDNYHVYDGMNYKPDNSFEEKERIMFIVDFSNSMNEKIRGIKKIDIALSTIEKILPAIPSNTYVGFRAYGYRTGFTQLDSCIASKLVVAPTKNAAPIIENQMYSLHARGTTPITYSLKQCVKGDFTGFSGKKRIILLTDGGENCDESPCTYALELMKVRKDFRIDVIALDLRDEEANAQLRCAALATSGKFYSANTSAQLLKSLQDSLNIEKEVSSTIIK